MAQSGITDPGLAAAAEYDYLVTGDPSIVAVEANLQQQGVTTTTAFATAASGHAAGGNQRPAASLTVKEAASGTTTADFNVYRSGDTLGRRDGQLRGDRA